MHTVRLNSPHDYQAIESVLRYAHAHLADPGFSLTLQFSVNNALGVTLQRNGGGNKWQFLWYESNQITPDVPTMYGRVGRRGHWYDVVNIIDRGLPRGVNFSGQTLSAAASSSFPAPESADELLMEFGRSYQRFHKRIYLANGVFRRGAADHLPETPKILVSHQDPYVSWNAQLPTFTLDLLQPILEVWLSAADKHPGGAMWARSHPRGSISLERRVNGSLSGSAQTSARHSTLISNMAYRLPYNSREALKLGKSPDLQKKISDLARQLGLTLRHNFLYQDIVMEFNVVDNPTAAQVVEAIGAVFGRFDAFNAGVTEGLVEHFVEIGINREHIDFVLRQV